MNNIKCPICRTPLDGSFVDLFGLYVMVVCKTLTIEDCEKMKVQIHKGKRPDMFCGMGLERFDLPDCDKILDSVIKRKGVDQ